MTESEDVRSDGPIPVPNSLTPLAGFTGEEVLPVPGWVPRVIGWTLVVAGALGLAWALIATVPFALETVQDAIESVEYIAAAMVVLFPVAFAGAALYAGWRLAHGNRIFPRRTQD